MLGAFLSCYLPSCIMIYLMNLCHTCSCELIHWLRDLHSLFIIFNSLINPFLYAFRLPNFKSAVVRMLHYTFREAPAMNPHTTGTRDQGPHGKIEVALTQSAQLTADNGKNRIDAITTKTTRELDPITE